MLNFLKKLFSSEEQKQEKKLTLRELEEWLSSADREKQEILKRRIAEFEQEFLEVKQGLDAQMIELQKATLQNTKIPPKAFHFMEGNRESYIRFMRQFLLGVSNFPKDANAIENYCSEFMSHLNQFATVSQRNYFVLQNFFANTLKDIGQLLKSLEGHVKRLLEEYEFSKMAQIHEIRKSLEELSNASAYKGKLEKEVLEAETSLKNASVEVKNAKDAFGSIEKGEEWTKLKDKEKEILGLKGQIRNQEQKISAVFSPLEKALKKFSKGAFDNHMLAEKYGESPSQALEEDKQLQIVSILEKLKVSLGKNGLGLDEKRIQKANAAIEGLTKESLLALQRELDVLKQKIAALDGEIALCSIQEEYEKQKKNLEILIESYERKKQALESLKNKKECIDEKKMLKELETSINQKLGEKISIFSEEN